MARQSIPRFDLYAALGVDPQADDDAVEAAYDALMERHGAGTGAAVERRIFRARVAREWLTDPELKERYDASRERAASRAAAKAAGAAPEGIAAEEDADDLPWMTADPDLADLVQPHAPAVDRPDPTIAWSATPPEPPESRRKRRRPGGSPVRAVGLGALLIAAAIAFYFVFQVFGSNDIASRRSPTPPPAETATAKTPLPPTIEPTVAPTVAPTVEPTVAPTAPPPTQGVDIAAMQKSAFDALQSLITAAAAGDVTTAQTYLGESAPGLRASGLKRVTFPQMTADQVAIAPSGDGYMATLTDGTTMFSTDGTTWTLQYGDRPLAAYRPPGTPVDHDLWWMPKNVKHHIYLHITIATVSHSGVTATAKWSFDPSLPDDATYFADAEFKISAVTLDGTAIPVLSDAKAMTSTNTLLANYNVDGSIPAPSELGLTIWVTPDGNPDRSVETTFVLDAR